MLWEDDSPAQNIPEATVTDMAFSIQCRQLPVDHLHALSLALQQAIPELIDDGIGIHEIHIAGSQNGWERPNPGLGQYLIPSRRTRLSLRIPKNRTDEISRKLQNLTLNTRDFELTLGNVKVRPISYHDTLYARHVLMQSHAEEQDENLFLQHMAEELGVQGIHVKKALCGKINHIHTADTPLVTRSLMIADLTPAESINLQQQGLGKHQHMGCGLFLPMKGIQHLSADKSD
jgi:CRISPR-associated protein Cas6